MDIEFVEFIGSCVHNMQPMLPRYTFIQQGHTVDTADALIYIENKVLDSYNTDSLLILEYLGIIICIRQMVIYKYPTVRCIIITIIILALSHRSRSIHCKWFAPLENAEVDDLFQVQLSLEHEIQCTDSSNFLGVRSWRLLEGSQTIHSLLY